MIADRVGSPLSERAALEAAIAAHLAEGHGSSWAYLPEQTQAEYLKDAAALVDQGLTRIWEDRDPGPNPSPELEVEAAEFDRAMQWWVDFVHARHPGWDRAGGIDVSPEMEHLDPEDWDAWVSIAVTVSEEARRLYMREFEQLHGVTAPAPVPPAPAVASSPPAAGHARRDRFATTVAAVLAFRHGQQWLRLPSDVREAYLRDARSLMAAGLTCWTD
ncbi:hypothetical protein MAHJHV61_48340 [Mycobacterium avium subsp. hominissuis]|uniref:Uncharacterized protein n=2 Tax=Mycobacterium avium TaxID=1764 RepID=A0A2A3LCW9_MYCAV|nr:hypothetical protein [Mycobacterium avium]MBZ4631625.1 hypothetical protein [Mycobacterium avium subsp. hominissuis]PBJ39050.1 hypothetical protein XV03_04140 [Mycobacterium avium subsp. hominissuis]QWY65213.1 hypothetical protein BJP78_26190 [Mycobacterium avium subsp. hominissuis]